jgi:hypothetical protein
MTWCARGYRSTTIDYILTNKKLSTLVNDTKVFTGYDVATDHYFDEKIQLDATSVNYSHKLTLHVSSIYMLIFGGTGCNYCIWYSAQGVVVVIPEEPACSLVRCV